MLVPSKNMEKRVRRMLLKRGRRTRLEHEALQARQAAELDGARAKVSNAVGNTERARQNAVQARINAKRARLLKKKANRE